jgi:ribosome-associated protein
MYTVIMEQEFEVLPKSKSQIKRELHELQALGKQLAELPNKQLATIPVSDILREAIVTVRSMKHGALARQFKFIGKLLKNENVDSILLALEKSKKPHKDEVEEFHQLEQWRDHLIEGDQNLLTELAIKFDNFDRQHVNQLIRNAKKEHNLSKPPKSSRLLFKYLEELKNS